MLEVAKDLIAPPSEEEESDEDVDKDDLEGGKIDEKDSISKFRCVASLALPCSKSDFQESSG